MSYRRQIVWSSLRHLRVEVLGVPRGTLRYMHRRGRTEWLSMERKYLASGGQGHDATALPYDLCPS